MKKSELVRTTILAVWAGLLVVTVVFTSDARATGRIVDGVKVSASEDMIPGVTFGEVPYAEYRGRFQGSLTLPMTPRSRSIPTTCPCGSSPRPTWMMPTEPS